jgi:hypothetical protein
LVKLVAIMKVIPLFTIDTYVSSNKVSAKVDRSLLSKNRLKLVAKHRPCPAQHDVIDPIRYQKMQRNDDDRTIIVIPLYLV